MNNINTIIYDKYEFILEFDNLNRIHIQVNDLEQKQIYTNIIYSHDIAIKPINKFYNLLINSFSNLIQIKNLNIQKLIIILHDNTIQLYNINVFTNKVSLQLDLLFDCLESKINEVNDFYKYQIKKN